MMWGVCLKVIRKHANNLVYIYVACMWFIPIYSRESYTVASVLREREDIRGTEEHEQLGVRRDWMDSRKRKWEIIQILGMNRLRK